MKKRLSPEETGRAPPALRLVLHTIRESVAGERLLDQMAYLRQNRDRAELALRRKQSEVFDGK